MYNCYSLTFINPHIPAEFSAQITLHIWAYGHEQTSSGQSAESSACPSASISEQIRHLCINPFQWKREINQRTPHWSSRDARPPAMLLAVWAGVGELRRAVILSKSLSACKLQILRFKELSEPQDVEAEREAVSSLQGVLLTLILQQIFS